MTDHRLSNEQIALSIFGPAAVGLGVGFFFFTTSFFTFVGCGLLGIGCGLLITLALTSCERA